MDRHQRHDDELLRRPDAVGRVGHLRGDRQRPRRRAPTSPAPEHRAHQAARVHLRGADDRPVRRRAGHQGGAVRPRVGRLRPARRQPLPHRGQLRLPVGLLPLHARGPHPWMPATSPTTVASRCSRSRVSTRPTSRRASARARATTWSGSTSTTRTPPSPTPPARPPRRPTTPRSSTSATRAGPRAPAGFSRLEGAIYDNGVVYFTSTQGGGAAMDGAERRAPGTATASARCGATTPAPRRSSSSTSRRRAQVLDFPDNITVSRRGTLVLCEDNTEDNYVRGLSRGGQLLDIALNRLAGRTGRRVRRVDLQPRRAHPVRQHPGQPRHDVRDLGTLAADRGLSAAGAPGIPRGGGAADRVTCARHPAWSRRALTGRRGPPCARRP